GHAASAAFSSTRSCAAPYARSRDFCALRSCEALGWPADGPPSISGDAPLVRSSSSTTAHWPTWACCATRSNSSSAADGRAGQHAKRCSTLEAAVPHAGGSLDCTPFDGPVSSRRDETLDQD